MISSITSPAAGNALQIQLCPPAGCRRWRLLRSTASVIPAFNSPNMVLVHDGREKTVLDTAKLINGTTVYYRAFYFVNGSWQASAVVSAVAQSTFRNETNDHLEFVRERIELGFAGLVARDVIAPRSGAVAVLSSSPELDLVRFPCITVHLAADDDAVRAVGEELADDAFDDDDLLEFEGYLSALQLTVIVWSKNSDERKLMRQQLKAVLMANLPVFDGVGMVQVGLKFADQEDFTSYPAPIYQAICTLSCMAPSVVSRPVPVINDVSVQADLVGHSVPVTP